MSKKKATRPPLATVEEIPPRCPRCQCTKRSYGDRVQKRRILGTTCDGRAYNQVRWFYASCAECGQRYKIIRREYLSVATECE